MHMHIHAHTRLQCICSAKGLWRLRRAKGLWRARVVSPRLVALELASRQPVVGERGAVVAKHEGIVCELPQLRLDRVGRVARRAAARRRGRGGRRGGRRRLGPFLAAKPGAHLCGTCTHHAHSHECKHARPLPAATPRAERTMFLTPWRLALTVALICTTRCCRWPSTSLARGPATNLRTCSVSARGRGRSQGQGRGWGRGRVGVGVGVRACSMSASDSSAPSCSLGGGGASAVGLNSGGRAPVHRSGSGGAPATRELIGSSLHASGP